jgi:hypothetical protein
VGKTENLNRLFATARHHVDALLLRTVGAQTKDLIDVLDELAALLELQQQTAATSSMISKGSRSGRTVAGPRRAASMRFRTAAQG